MPIRAQAAGSQTSPHSALGRSRGHGAHAFCGRSRRLHRRAAARMKRERYRVYGEEEFFAGAGDEHEPPLELPPSAVEAPPRHRVAGIAVLLGVVGAVVAVIALDVLGQGGAARRKAAPQRMARAGVGSAAANALRRVKVRPTRVGQVRESAVRGRTPARRSPRRPGSRRRDNSALAEVDRTKPAASMRLADDGHATVARSATPTAPRPAENRAGRATVANSGDEVPRLPRVEFGFER
jgi:hypothetical protein